MILHLGLLRYRWGQHIGRLPYAALNLGLLEKRFSKLSLFLLVTATTKVQTPFETYIIKDIYNLCNFLVDPTIQNLVAPM